MRTIFGSVKRIDYVMGTMIFDIEVKEMFGMKTVNYRCALETDDASFAQQFTQNCRVRVQLSLNVVANITLYNIIDIRRV